MDLAILIVSWNVRDLLRNCLHSVHEALAGTALRWRALVVDNASTDGSTQMVRQEFPDVTVLELAENRGFAGGNNEGMRLLGLAGDTPTSSPGEAVLLLNADAEVEPGAIATMVEHMAAHPEVGVIGPRLRFADGSKQPSRRRFPTVGTLFWESTVLERWWPGNPWARRYHRADRPDDVEQEVDWLVGACLLVRAEAIRQAGLLDEGYFLYFEELEWCRRIRQAGWKIVYLPAAQAVHHEGRSTEQVPLQRHLYFQHSKLRYAWEAFGPFVAGSLRLFLLASYGWEWLVEGAKWVVGHKRELRRERMRVYAAVLSDLTRWPGDRVKGRRLD